jgi:hypothetical protein
MKRPIRQMAHLGVATFACVLTQRVRQDAYLLEGQQHRGTKNAFTQVAARTVSIQRLQLARLTDWADKVVERGCYGEGFHFVSSNSRSNEALKAECEHERQHEQAQDTQRRPDEQRDHRRDRIFYMVKWLTHSISSAHWALRALYNSEQLYERFAWPVLLRGNTLALSFAYPPHQARSRKRCYR